MFRATVSLVMLDSTPSLSIQVTSLPFTRSERMCATLMIVLPMRMKRGITMREVKPLGNARRAR